MYHLGYQLSLILLKGFQMFQLISRSDFQLKMLFFEKLRSKFSTRCSRSFPVHFDILISINIDRSYQMFDLNIPLIEGSIVNFSSPYF